MEVFYYKAMNDQGRVLTGQADAINPGDLELRLRRMGLDLINYRELRSRGSRVSSRGIKRVDLITFFFHLEHLVRAGVPILEGLADLRDSVENPKLRDVTSAMIESIEGGKTLSQAMREFPGVFGEVLCNLVLAGEDSGELTQVMQHIVENLKWQDEQAAYTKKLLMYPLFVGSVVIAVVFFLMTYLVPELLSFVSTMGQELPGHTKVLIAVSNAFVDYWYAFLLVPVGLVAGAVIGAKTSPAIAFKIDQIKLKAPVVGPIYQKIILTRFTSYFAIMYSAGITVLDCIRVGESIAGNKVVEQAVRTAGRQIADGVGISASFTATGLFPPLVLRMLRVGENTGALEEALRNVSYFYTRDVKESIERLQAMIEPAMTVVLGAILAWIMFSVLGPIYDLITQIQI